MFFKNYRCFYRDSLNERKSKQYKWMSFSGEMQILLMLQNLLYAVNTALWRANRFGILSTVQFLVKFDEFLYILNYFFLA